MRMKVNCNTLTTHNQLLRWLSGWASLVQGQCLASLCSLEMLVGVADHTWRLCVGAFATNTSICSHSEHCVSETFLFLFLIFPLTDVAGFYNHQATDCFRLNSWHHVWGRFWDIHFSDPLMQNFWDGNIRKIFWKFKLNPCSDFLNLGSVPSSGHMWGFLCQEFLLWVLRGDLGGT